MSMIQLQGIDKALIVTSACQAVGSSREGGEGSPSAPVW